MAILTLAGTAWRLNQTLDQQITPGPYDLDFLSGFDAPDYTDRYTFDSIELDGLGGLWYHVPNTSSYANPMTWGGQWDSTLTRDYRLVIITGGTDAATAETIAWFEANAEQIDLSGTTWELGQTLDISADASWDIEFTSGFDAQDPTQHEEFDCLALSAATESMDYTSSLGQDYTPYTAGAWDNSFTEDFTTIVIVEGDDITNAELIDWLLCNGTQVETDNVTVTYDGYPIVSTSAAGTYTLECAETVMKSNVIVRTDGTFAVTVSYDGSDIIDTSAAGTYTIACGGKLMADDITVTIAGSSPVVVLHEQVGSTLMLYGAYTRSQSGDTLTIT